MAANSHPQMRALLAQAHKQQAAMVELLGELVRCESPSFDKAAVDRCGAIVAREWSRRFGTRKARMQVLKQRERGNHVRVEIAPDGRESRGQLLVIGHLDTVYDLGTLRKMPFRVSGGRAYGPGTFDMKGGLTIALFAMDALRALGIAPRKRIVCLWTSDEEIGSDTAIAHIEHEARRSDAALVLEPALGRDGRLKTARKGVGHAELIVTGRATHAGINPQDGVNAVHELAMQIARIAKFNDPRRGVTVNADVVSGGTRVNVIAESARAEIDLRATRMRDARELNRKLRALRPILPGAKIEIRGGIERPPLERTAQVVRLYRHAQRLAREMGVALGEGSTGGGSDGNLTAAVGCPTLDGLGAVGDGAHSAHEHVVINKLPERAALLAGLLSTL